ncbi:MAG: hypothetical protein H6Q67_2179 [Firmicutes bacterium]|nr:hypothetical protein [Bacillota bacterium]
MKNILVACVTILTVCIFFGVAVGSLWDNNHSKYDSDFFHAKDGVEINQELYNQTHRPPY